VHFEEKNLRKTIANIKNVFTMIDFVFLFIYQAANTLYVKTQIKLNKVVNLKNGNLCGLMLQCILETMS